MNRMADLCSSSDLFGIEKHFGCLKDSEWDIINFRYNGTTSHTELGGQLIKHPNFGSRIIVEMRAARWDPDPPTRDAYVASAKHIFGFALTAYNRKYAKRYRLRIRRARIGPKPSKYTLELLDRFCVLANHQSLHTLDWRRYYDFIRNSRQELPAEILRLLLMERGFSENKAEHLADVYEHIWAYKQLARSMY